MVMPTRSFCLRIFRARRQSAVVTIASTAAFTPKKIEVTAIACW